MSFIAHFHRCSTKIPAAKLEISLLEVVPPRRESKSVPYFNTMKWMYEWIDYYYFCKEKSCLAILALHCLNIVFQQNLTKNVQPKGFLDSNMLKSIMCCHNINIDSAVHKIMTKKSNRQQEFITTDVNQKVLGHDECALENNSQDFDAFWVLSQTLQKKNKKKRSKLILAKNSNIGYMLCLPSQWSDPDILHSTTLDLLLLSCRDSPPLSCGGKSSISTLLIRNWLATKNIMLALSINAAGNYVFFLNWSENLNVLSLIQLQQWHLLWDATQFAFK